jgi:hypothetical protein
MPRTLPRLAQARPMTDKQNTVRATLASPVSSLPYPRGPKVAQNSNNPKHDKRTTTKECHAEDTQLSANNNQQPTTNDTTNNHHKIVD